MSRSLTLRAAVPLVAGLSLLTAGCATTNEALVEEITRTEASIQQVQQSGQTREAGGLELEQAKDKAARARRALENGDESTARRMAAEARLDADLAAAKANSHDAQQAVQEVMASIEALRRETGRQGPQTTTSDARDE